MTIRERFTSELLLPISLLDAARRLSSAVVQYKPSKGAINNVASSTKTGSEGPDRVAFAFANFSYIALATGISGCDKQATPQQQAQQARAAAGANNRRANATISSAKLCKCKAMPTLSSLMDRMSPASWGQ